MHTIDRRRNCRFMVAVQVCQVSERKSIPAYRSSWLAWIDINRYKGHTRAANVYAV